MNTINAQISARILASIGNGSTVEQAIDAVLGEGTFAALASDVHSALTAS